MKEKLHYILLLITILLVAGISLANMQSVNVSFYPVQLQTSLNHIDFSLSAPRLCHDLSHQHAKKLLAEKRA